MTLLQKAKDNLKEKEVKTRVERIEGALKAKSALNRDVAIIDKEIENLNNTEIPLGSELMHLRMISSKLDKEE